METRGRRKVYHDRDSDDDDYEHSHADGSPERPARPSSAAGPSKRSISRGKGQMDDMDVDMHDDDKLSEETLQKQLKTITDEREIKRIKRLLRNRVSAQQARERKKQYVSELEHKLQAKDEQIARLSQDLRRVATTNATLRRLIQTMRSGSAMPVPPSVARGGGVSSEKAGSASGSAAATSDGAAAAAVPSEQPAHAQPAWEAHQDTNVPRHAHPTWDAGQHANATQREADRIRDRAVLGGTSLPQGAAKHSTGGDRLEPRLIPVTAMSTGMQSSGSLPMAMDGSLQMSLPSFADMSGSGLYDQGWPMHSHAAGPGRFAG